MSEELDEKTTFSPCCFCGREIPATDIDPCRLTVETQAGKMAGVVLSLTCFKDHLVDNPMLEPAHL